MSNSYFGHKSELQQNYHRPFSIFAFMSQLLHVVRFHVTTARCMTVHSAPKQQLLTQHIRVHFCPLPELSDWLIENGQSERAQEVNDIDLTQALEVAEKFQKSSKRKLNRVSPAKTTGEDGGMVVNDL